MGRVGNPGLPPGAPPSAQGATALLGLRQPPRRYRFAPAAAGPGFAPGGPLSPGRQPGPEDSRAEQGLGAVPEEPPLARHPARPRSFLAAQRPRTSREHQARGDRGGQAGTPSFPPAERGAALRRATPRPLPPAAAPPPSLPVGPGRRPRAPRRAERRRTPGPGCPGAPGSRRRRRENPGQSAGVCVGFFCLLPGPPEAPGARFQARRAPRAARPPGGAPGARPRPSRGGAQRL